jgi:hypothetical protein
MPSLRQLCEPRESVFNRDRRATVLSLDTFLNGAVDGPSFFEENHFTAGMLTLVDRALRHLAGGDAGSSIFHLSQAMGGGKTHSMIALGLLARDPQLRRDVLGDKDPAPRLATTRVVGFNGRSTDAPGGIWGTLASQLGHANRATEHNTSAPGPNAWKELLGKQPLIVFLDEIPPYLAYVSDNPHAIPGIAVVTATLANLFVSVAESENVCLVMSDLAGTNYASGQNALNAALLRAQGEINAEARRAAVPITPVSEKGDELYHILRKRIFKKNAPEAEVNRVAESYCNSLRTAVGMGLTTTSPESTRASLLETYPFHFGFTDLFGKFKENDGFQQTRGIIRLMQILVADLWTKGKADSLELIHPYDFDFNVNEIASELGAINNKLNAAIAHDIADHGRSEAEQIDATNGTSDASDATKLLLLASLSTTGVEKGLRQNSLIDFLQQPGRDLSKFKTDVLDKLGTRAWYLHSSSDGRLFFKDQQNLAAKLQSLSQSLHAQVVDEELKRRLSAILSPSIKDCYQSAAVFPPLDEVQLEQDKTTLIVVRPGGNANQLPISSEWQAWWQQQPFKNRVLFLTGSRDIFQRLVDCARQVRAIEDIRQELESEALPANDPQWVALETLKVRVALQFSAALKEAFDNIVYPSIDNALRPTGVDLAFAENQSVEATIKHTLESANKFTANIADDSFRRRVESKLFGGEESKTVLWSDLKRAAAVRTDWPLHKTSALEDLKNQSIERGHWRAEGNHIRRGPFPPPEPEVSIREISSDDATGKTFLKIEPLNASSLVFEAGDSIPTRHSSPVPTPARFETTALRYKFLAFDPQDLTRTSVVKEWTAKLRLKNQLHHRGDHYEVELLALPASGSVAIRYTTDGSAPTGSSAATYDGSFRVPPDCRVVCGVALASELGIASETIRIAIPQSGEEVQSIDLVSPCRWIKATKRDDTAGVWDFIARLEQTPATTSFDISLVAESADGFQIVDYSGALESGYTAAQLKELATRLQDIAGTGAKLRLTIGTLSFPSGQALLDWLRAINEAFDANYISE